MLIHKCAVMPCGLRIAVRRVRIADKLVAMTDDDSLAVRYQLAFTSEGKHAEKVDALARLIPAT